MSGPSVRSGKLLSTFTFAQQELNSFYSKYNIAGASPEIAQEVLPVASLNGFIPLTKNPDVKTPLKGESPYWYTDRIPAALLNEFFPVEPESEFICAHFADSKAHARFEKLFGKPHGLIQQSMLANQRTVSGTLGTNPMPLMKFSSIDSENSPLSADKLLALYKFTKTIAEKFKNVSGVLPEKPGFLFVDPAGSGLSLILRDLPFREELIQDQDVYLPLFAVYSPQLKGTTSLYDISDYHHWFQTQIFEKLADFILESFFTYGVHFELHQQNINILFSGRECRSLFVQDLTDVVEDPIAQSLYAKIKPTAFSIAQLAPFGYCGQFFFDSATVNPNSIKSIGSWYRKHLRDFGQHEITVNTVFMNGKTINLQKIVEDKLQMRLAQFLHLHQISEEISHLKEYKVVFGPEYDLYSKLNALRDLLNITFMHHKTKNHLPLNDNETFNSFSELHKQTSAICSYGFSLKTDFESFSKDWHTWTVKTPGELNLILQKNKSSGDFRYCAFFRTA